MGLGQHDSLGEYCDPHTTSSVFLMLVNAFRTCINEVGQKSLCYHTKLNHCDKKKLVDESVLVPYESLKWH